MPSQKAWDYYFRTLKRLIPDAEHQQQFYFRLLRTHVRPGITWLDAGCGHTLVPEWIKGAKELEEWFLTTARAVVGCDVDRSSLNAPSRIRRAACNIEQLCFRPGTFELITCNGVIEHVEHPGRAFREFFQALKPRGALIVHTPNLFHWSTLIARATPFWFHRIILKWIAEMELHDVFSTRFRANTAKTLRRLLLAAGFQDITIHLVPGRPRLVGFGPFLHVECMLHRIVRRFPQAGEFLCAVARRR